MSKRPVVKAKPAHPPTIAPMMESLGLIVLLDPAPFSKDETTTGGLHAMDRLDVVTALVPEEDVWQFEVMKTCAKERFSFKTENRNQFRLWTARSQCLQNHNKCGKEKPKRCKSLMSSKSKWKLTSRKFEGYQTGRYGQNVWKHERIQTSLGTSCLVSALEKAVLSRNQGPRDVDG